MAFETRVPLWIAELPLSGGHSLCVPVLYPEAATLDTTPQRLGRAFSEAAWKTWSRRGLALPWIDAAPELHLELDSIAVSIRPSGQDPALPKLTLTVDAAVSPLPERAPLPGKAPEAPGWHAFAPALGVSAWGADRAEALAHLGEAVDLELVRHGRLTSARALLETQLTESLLLDRQEVKATFYTPNEQRELNEQKPDPWLPRAATAVRPDRARAFGVDQELAALGRALTTGASLLVVGAPGTGKSALVEELIRRGHPSLSGAVVHATTAAALERVLTGGDGWQANLTALCAELAAERAVLWVRDLAELFEVGRYEGNPTSMGEFLRPFLEREQIRLLAEVSPEALARLDALYPGYSLLFKQFELKVMPSERLLAVLEARANADAGRPVSPAGVRLAFRLLQRFAPYSGYPARAVRFLEPLVAAGGALDPDDVLDHFSRSTGVPRALVDPSWPSPADEIRRELEGAVYGQPAATGALTDLILSVRGGLTRAGRPILSLLLAGPTGVGKTETAKALARLMFGSRDRITRLDMSEFSTAGGAMLLIEGPDGEGRLTGAVRRQPFCVLLLDEIEKAHPSVFDLLLSVLGEGRLTDGRGRVADFCSAVILLTSNLGVGEADRSPPGFQQEAGAASAWGAALARFFRPELLNRIDRIIPYAPLGPDSVRRVLDRELLSLHRRPGLLARFAELHVHPDALQRVSTLGYDPRWGARHLQRAARRHLLIPLARALNAARGDRPQRIELVVRGSGLGVLSADRPPEQDPRRLLGEAEDQAEGLAELRRVVVQVSDGYGISAIRAERDRLERSRLLYILRQAGRLGARAKAAADGAWRASANGALLRRLSGLVDEVAAVRVEVEATERMALVAALADAPQPPRHVDLPGLTRRARRLWRDLFEHRHAGESRCFVGVYGTEAQVAITVEAYQALVRRLGWTVDLYPCWSSPELGRAVGAWECVRFDKKGKPLGVEMDLRGIGGRQALAGEVGLHVLAGPAGEDTARREGVSVVVAPLAASRVVPSVDARPAGRPLNVDRASILAGVPRRQRLSDKVVDRESKERFPAHRYARALTDHLVERFERLVLEDLVS